MLTKCGRAFAVFASAVLIVSCQKNAEKVAPESNASMASGKNESVALALQANHGLGAVLLSEEAFDKLPKGNAQALREKALKQKGATTAQILAAVPPTYAIDGPAIGDQGQEGSCVGWATAWSAAGILDHVFTGTAYPTAWRSPEYVYNQVKISDCGSGTYISRALDLIKNQGVCGWAEMPYTDASCSTMPNATQKDSASHHKFTSWATVTKNSVSAVKSLVSANLPVILGITVDQSFYDMGRTTGATWSSHYGRVYGGHAVAIIGYDDAKQAFKVQNQWGTNWGQNGYFWITYTFFAKKRSSAANEAYVAYVQ